MLDKDTKTRINNARDVLVGKVPDPKSQVEQITIALIYKFMDDIDNDLIEWGSSKTYFTGEYEKYKWSNLLSNSLSGEERLNLYVNALDQISKNENIPQLFRDIFKNAFLPYRDPETLKLFLKEIDWFDYHNSEKLGDSFEYLLSIMSSQGDAGQFRTPRHIIDFIVDIVRPQKHERILDPACGTAGFLISAFKYIMESNKNAGTDLTPEEREALVSNFSGYDISPDMVRLSLVNLYLHGFQDPHIYEYDTLTSEEKWGDKFDVILANPPFMTPKGGIRPHGKFVIKAKRSEVLFVDYMIEHLRPNGRAGIIVPEGIIFQSGTAYKNLRKELIEGKNLWAVVSLPAGVFNPYSGVKTSILLLDKEIAKKTDKILFVDIKNDGFELGAQRKRINGCDLPDALSELIKYHDSIISGEEYIPESEMFNAVEIAKISEKGEYNLSGNRYKEIKLVSSNYEMFELGEVCDIRGGGTPSKNNEEYWTNGSVKWISAKHIGENNKIGFYELITENAVVESSTNIAPVNSTILVTRVSVGKVAFADDNYAINQDLTYLYPKTDKLIPKYLFYIVNSISNIISDSAQGLGVKGVTRSYIQSFKIPVPAPEIQTQIVHEIESYQNILESAKNIVENYKPSFKINHDWRLVELGEVCEKITDGSHNPPEPKDSGELMLSSRNIFDDNLVLDTVRYISPEDFENENKRTDIKKGDVLLTIVGTIGRTLVVTDNHPKFTLQRSVSVLKPLNMLNSKYLSLILRTDPIQEYLNNNARGVAQKGIYLKTLKELKIPLPDPDEQQKIVEKIEEEQKIIAANKRLIEIYENKIKSIIGDIWEE
ncbi:N-6 DNA methylase [Methanococcus maripaludis]|uniref:site-specific DNA-methyltransferase (adenine-specific) n=1 Tax=Methanococcus maripaludis TaxID=39152 RepID=A0A7J9PN49_METMI|nr:N-6 DNA methylase [Methanococcus maripaludis]MBA2864713.1 type I restriction enzyme M protein [Methanococcus maripaludis]MBB6497567.1 type I restriction enzyme M protein [Methanococcus maripaludis]